MNSITTILVNTSKIIAFLEGKPVFATGHAQLELFSNVWGAGPKSVKHWISKVSYLYSFSILIFGVYK